MRSRGVDRGGREERDFTVSESLLAGTRGRKAGRTEPEPPRLPTASFSDEL